VAPHDHMNDASYCAQVMVHSLAEHRPIHRGLMPPPASIICLPGTKMFRLLLSPAQVISLLIPFFRFGFCSTSLIFMLAYVWSKNFATQNVSLYGLLTVQARSLLRPVEALCSGRYARPITQPASGCGPPCT